FAVSSNHLLSLRPQRCAGSLPFEFRVRSGDVAAMEFIEQSPGAALVGPYRLHRLRERAMGRERILDAAPQVLQISLLRRKYAWPGCRASVARDRDFRGHLLQFVQSGEHSAQLSVDHRYVLFEDKITEEEHLARRVVNGHVLIGMRGRPRTQRKRSPTQV